MGTKNLTDLSKVSAISRPFGAACDMFVAIALNNHERVNENLRANPDAVHARNGDGKTPFHCAIESGHLEIAELLLRNGADINPRTPYGTTPLHWAAVRGRLRLVRFLIENGADANAKDVWKVTPRELALRMGHREVASLLAALGQSGRRATSPQDDDLNLWLIRTWQR